MKMLRNFFVDHLAIDLGSVNTIICAPDRGIILNEPSVVALDKYSREVITVGHAALKLLGREPREIEVHRPIRGGAIDNFEITQKMLKAFLKRVRGGDSHAGWGLRRSHVVIGVPGSSTTIEQRSIREAAREVRAGRVDLIDEGLAAAVGADVELEDEHARLVIDIGGGTTNVAIVASGAVVSSLSLPVAGNAMDDAIREYMRTKYSMQIGEGTAETVKRELGTAHDGVVAAVTSREVVGKHMSDGAARPLEIEATEVRVALEPTIIEIVRGTRRVIEEANPEVTSDLYYYGVLLTGGGALLSGLVERLRDELQLHVVLADEPLTCVARGAGRLLNEPEKLERVAIRRDVRVWESSPELVVNY
jgi:rod shape-determining protein MreB and related proteins